MLLVGSTCLQIHVGDIGRQPRDVDIIGTSDELRELARALRAKRRRISVEPLSSSKSVIFAANPMEIYEFEIAWPGSAAHDLCEAMYGLSESTVMPRQPGGTRHWPLLGHAVAVAPLDVLYTLKMSHRHLKNSPHFMKTMRDIRSMRKLGAKIFDEGWLKRREDETYTYNHPKLNVMKGDFFRGDGVEYVYDHDDIHNAVAHYYDHSDSDEMTSSLPVKFKPNPAIPRPAYTLYMQDGAEVQCSRQKFFDAPEAVRLYGVLEEAYVLALERSQIPHRGNVTPRRSFQIALEKVCTSITSGWFREYAWENYDRVWELYSDDYVDRFWKAVDSGMVRKLDNGKDKKTEKEI